MKNLLIGTAVCALLSTNALAEAQESETEQSGSVARVLESVTVTATKKKNVEDVQDVPLSVTAFNESTLDALNIQTIQGLAVLTPNVSLDEAGTWKGIANFSIRGLGVAASIPSVDPTVGVFIDGVYLGTNGGVVVDLFDVDSIEVLRGPQGILFGRNTTGGAVLINTANPSDELTYKARLAMDGPVDGGRGGLNSVIQGSISGPIVPGKLNATLGAYYNTDEGYFKNEADGSDHGEAQTTVLRAGLEFIASEDLTFLLKAEHYDSRGDGPSTQNRGQYSRDSFRFAVNDPGEAESQSTLVSLRTDLDVAFGDGVITNILGYRDYRDSARIDFDGRPVTLLHVWPETDQDQISNELRYAGSFGKADITTGLFYFEQSLAYDESRSLPPVTPLRFYGGGKHDHSVRGVFANIDYNLTDTLVASGGLRYSTEEKDASVTFLRPRPACSVIGGTCPSTGTNPLIPEDNGFNDKDDWSSLSPKLGLQWFASDDTQIYGTWSRGFRSGGFNFRVTNVPIFLQQFAQTGSRGYDQETLDSYEIGLKTDFAEGRGQLNAALWRSDITDMQREVNISSPTAGVTQFILNTADAQLQGLELEGRFALTDTLLITGNLGLTDSEYKKVLFDISGDGLVNAADLALTLPRAPETTYGFGVIHDWSLGDAGTLTSRVTYKYLDKYATTDNNFGFNQDHQRLDADFSWATPMNGVTVSLYGKNLLDEVQVGADTPIPFGGVLSTGLPARPFASPPNAGTGSPLQKGRVVGLEISVRR